MKDKLFAFIIGRPYWTTLIALLLVAMATFGGQFLIFKGDYKVFFAEDDPKLIAYNSVQETFNKTDSIVFIVAPKDKNVFSKATLESVRDLTEEAWQIPHSSRVDSLTNYQHSMALDDDLIVEDLVPDYQELNTAKIASVKNTALNEPLLIDKIISPSGHVTVVNVTVQLNESDLEPIIVAKAQELQQKYMSENPNLNILLSGMVAVNASFPEAAIYDNTVYVPAMFLVVTVLMLLLLRNFSGTISTVIVVIASIAGGMGLTGWLGIDLSGPTASAPIMILTLAVADCIHVLSSAMFEMRNGVNKKNAILESIKINLKPILLTSVTTAIGFLSMNFSDSPPFRDLGNIVAIGVMLACILSLTLYPALLSILPMRVKAEQSTQLSLMAKLADKIIEHHRKVFVAMMVVIISLVILLPKNTLNDNFVEYFDPTTKVRQSADFMNENLSGIILLEVAVESNQKSGITSPEYLQKLEEFSQWFKKQNNVDHVASLTDIFKKLNKNMHQDNEQFYRLPENKELAAQYLLLYEMSLPYGLDLNNQINISKSSTRVVGTLANLTSVELLALERDVKAWFSHNAPEYTVMVTGPDLMFAHIGQNNIYSMLSGTSIALVLISILIGFSLRSIRYAFISLLPNLAPAAMGFGAWYLLDGQIGLGLSVVAGMTLGIVVDFTVHYLTKYLHAKRTKQLDTEQAIKYAFANVGKALWVTTIVLVCGFIVMAQSTFKLNADMGFLTAITIFIALIVDFFFLPPLLLLIDRKVASKAIATANTQAI